MGTKLHPLLLQCIQRLPFRRGRQRLVKQLLRSWAPGGSPIVAQTPRGFRMEMDTNRGYLIGYLLGDYEPGTCRLLSRTTHAGDVFVDAGANVGYFTLLASRLVGPSGQVHAFEPEPSIALELQRNIELNCVPNATVSQQALGDTVGEATIHRFLDLPCGHSSLRVVDDGPHVSSKVPMITLDDYLEHLTGPRCDFLKVDVEGSEWAVLKGAERVLTSAHPPVIICEMNEGTSQAFGYSVREVLDWIRGCAGYGAYDITRTGELLPWGRTAQSHTTNVVLAIEQAHAARLSAVLAST